MDFDHTIELLGEPFVLSPLPLAAMERFVELYRTRKDSLRLLALVVHASLRMKYPRLELEQVESNIDYPTALRAIGIISRLTAPGIQGVPGSLRGGIAQEESAATPRKPRKARGSR